MENKKCPLCCEIVYSGIGEGCKMCGMVLENPDEKFCSERCKKNKSCNLNITKYSFKDK